MSAATCTKELSRRSVGQCGTATNKAPRKIASIRVLIGIAQAAIPDTARE